MMNFLVEGTKLLWQFSGSRQTTCSLIFQRIKPLTETLYSMYRVFIGSIKITFKLLCQSSHFGTKSVQCFTLSFTHFLLNFCQLTPDVGFKVSHKFLVKISSCFFRIKSIKLGIWSTLFISMIVSAWSERVLPKSRHFLIKLFAIRIQSTGEFIVNFLFQGM